MNKRQGTGKSGDPDDLRLTCDEPGYYALVARKYALKRIETSSHGVGWERSVNGLPYRCPDYWGRPELP